MYNKITSQRFFKLAITFESQMQNIVKIFIQLPQEI